MLRLVPCFFALSLIALLLAGAGTARAQESIPLPRDLPSLISADEVLYDQDLGVVTASGHVEISHGQRVLLADAVSYNLRSKVVTASGNVSLMDPSGDVVFADYVELSDDLKEGFIKDIRILLSDRSRLAAASGLRTAGNRTQFNRTVYSPCNLCKEDPEKAPLWQLKADKVIHDQEERVIKYRDAYLEFFGVPVLYTPYFEHPDPTVKRKSGFLAPTVGIDDFLGGIAQIPYYWAIAPNQDLTVAPIFTTKQGVVAVGEYRHLLPYGEYNIEGSGTIADRENSSGSVSEDVFRGHIDANGTFDLDKNWRTGFTLERTTDDTYLRRYNFSNDSVLVSNAVLEGFEGRNYAALNGYSYQGVRTDDDNDEAPIVLPLADVNFVSEPWIGDSVYSFDLNALVLSRLEGRNTRRLSGTASWSLPYTDPIGGLYKVTARVAADGYRATDFDSSDPDNPNPPAGSGSDETVGRIFPQLAVDWRYPWVSRGEMLTQTVEPRVQVVVGPNDDDQSDIPNEDSQDFEFDDTNLFSLNRFPGRDRVDPGQRIDYGFTWSGTLNGRGQASAFLGQSYRFSDIDDGLFPAGSGVEDRLSDIVGRVHLNPIDHVNLLYRFRLDKDNLQSRRNELGAFIGPPALNLGLNYLFIAAEDEGETEFGDREEIDARVSSELTDYWSVFVSGTRDLQLNKTLEARVGVAYSDECFTIETIGRRSFFSDRDVSSDTSFFVRIVFKHLGEVGT